MSRLNFNPIEGIKPTLKHLSINVLSVDHNYQRPHITSRSRRIAQNFNIVSLGVLSVSRRKDGSYWIFDGQHRYEGAKSRGDVKTLPCEVYEDLTVKQEAEAFLLMNEGRAKPTSLEKFKAKIEAGDQTARIAHRAMQKLGIKPSKSNTVGHIKCVGDLENYIEANEEAAIDALTLLTDMDAPITQILLGGMFYLKNVMGLDYASDKRLRERLIKTGWEKLEARAKSVALAYGKGSQLRWAEGIREEVNRGLMEHRRF